MKRASCLACLALASLALASLAVPALAASKTPDPMAKTKAAFDRPQEIEGLLRRGEWTRAEAEARTGIAEDVEHEVVDLAELLDYLAVAEEGQGRHEDAAWHWQEARGMADAADFSTFGAPGAALGRFPVRRLDEAAAGLAVRREGDGGPPLIPAHRVSGEEAKLPGSRWNTPRGIHVQAIVDAEGRVRQPVVVHSTFPTLTYVVLEAMRGWRFTPAQAGGQPVASFYELKVPVAKPFDQVFDFSKSVLAEPSELLKAGRYQEAEAKIELLWRHALSERKNDQTASFFGVALMERALAEAGLGREDDAICRYQAAQTLEPRLYGADLSAFGTAGALLMRHPWGSEHATVRRATPPPFTRLLAGALATNQDVVRPQIVSRKYPDFPLYARSSHLEGSVIAETIVTESGAVRDLILLKTGPTTGFDAAALDAYCNWRFKPATWKGQPVKAYYTTTINFEPRLH